MKNRTIYNIFFATALIIICILICLLIAFLISFNTSMSFYDAKFYVSLGVSCIGGISVVKGTISDSSTKYDNIKGITKLKAFNYRRNMKDYRSYSYSLNGMYLFISGLILFFTFFIK